MALSEYKAVAVFARHCVLYLLQDNNGRQSSHCVHANFEPDELQKTIDLHTCHAYLVSSFYK